VAGLIIREAHFPGRAPIDFYGAGGFRFAEMSHKGSILCLPSGIHGWTVERPDQITLETLAKPMAEAAGIEVLLIGTGLEPYPLGKALRTALREAGIKHDIMTTGAAVRTYNVLVEENRSVAAALIVV
jgi:uncharacterized protein